MVVGECEFKNAPMDYSALASLEEHADAVRWTPRDGGDLDVEYALFTRSGATQAVREAVADRDDPQPFDLREIVRIP